MKEGPSHEPCFRSMVIVNEAKYESLPGFFNRKAAEHSAAEVALMQLCKSGEVNESIFQPVHETGLCKNILQEYAQKMNFAIPVYHCEKIEVPGRMANFSCTIEIGGIRYIGGQATTKKEAEIKAARTALLAIQSSTSESSNMGVGNSLLKVIPCRKRAIETADNPDDTVNVRKAKKARFKKKMLKTKLPRKNGDHSQHETTGNSAVGSDDSVKPEWVQTDSLAASSSETLAANVTRNLHDTKIESSETLATNVMRNLHDTKIESDSSEQVFCADVALASQVADNCRNGQLTAADSTHSNHEAPDVEISSMVKDDPTNLVKLTDGDGLPSVVNNPTLSQMEVSYQKSWLA
ncbi:hypothetical protein PTKIN_Ptkin01aG0050900 [Pterospermum kingtungense]